MTRLVYIEDAVAAHPRAQRILAHFAKATRVHCSRYSEVFNPRAQNFRLQKSDPALLLARKLNKLVLPAPTGYAIGGLNNYYFSHMLNCVYDCRYCFLQGMFRSAHYVVFVNYEDFAQAIDGVLAQHRDEDCWFFSGHDCDSLAYDPLTGFAQWALECFAARPRAQLEFRTKSTQIRSLLARPALNNVVVAFSFTPQSVHAALENKVPGIDKRIAAMLQLAHAGWRIGLRFDPLIYSEGYAVDYGQLFERVFSDLPVSSVHSVSFGAFRLPRDSFKTLVNLYPGEPLLAGPLNTDAAMVGYRDNLETELLEFCRARLSDYVGDNKLYPCQP
ncbi:MAG: DNA photolyase [Gammaproteobacteria bacterium]|nr:DNA photolyase [Gammaproteobacteria bacterium]